MNTSLKRNLRLLLLLLTAWGLTGCSTSKPLSFQDLKTKERVYFGSAQVILEGAFSQKTECDFFINAKVNPVFKTISHRAVTFFNSHKSPRVSEIACIYEIDQKKHWVYFSLDIPKFKKPEAENQMFYFGNLKIFWTVSQEDLETLKANAIFSLNQKISNLGTLRIERSNLMESDRQDLLRSLPELAEYEVQIDPHLPSQN